MKGHLYLKLNKVFVINENSLNLSASVLIRLTIYSLVISSHYPRLRFAKRLILERM
jgi:hypothetical protein